MEMRQKLPHSIRMEAERSSPHQIITATKAKFVGIFRNNKIKHKYIFHGGVSTGFSSSFSH
jgi:hypothetical protein